MSRSFYESPLRALEKKTSFRPSALSQAEQTVHAWYIDNPEQLTKRKEAMSMTDMDSFKRPSGPYLPAEVDSDKQLVRNERGKEGHRFKTERAEILEAVLSKWAKEARWFGDNCEVVPTLEYDDRINHTDFVLVFRKSDGSTVKLAVDCTVTDNMRVLSEKIFHTAKGIETNYLTTIKYFANPETRQKQKIRFVPRVIAAAENDKMKEICESVLVATKKGDRSELNATYLQYYLLREFDAQLEAQLKIVNSGRVMKDSARFSAMKKNIEEARKMISAIIEQKKRSLGPKVVQRADREIVDSRVFKELPSLQAKSSQELRR